VGVALRSQKGFSLIENIIAIAVLGVIGAVLLCGMAMAARSNIIANEKTTAESLAKSQMDYVQNLPYDRFHNPPVYGLISNIPSGYTISVSAVRLDPAGTGLGNDQQLQQVTVTVLHGSKTISTLTDYKVNR